MAFDGTPDAPAPQMPPPIPVAPPPFPLAHPHPAGVVPHNRLHPLTLFFAGWNAVRGLFLPLLALVIFGRRDVTDLGWVPVALGIAGIAVAWSLVRYYTFSYWIAAGELNVRSGLLSRTERRIPLTRVQDVRLKQGVLHRLLRMAEVQVETAGGKGAEATLSVLSMAEATRLREAIFAQRAAMTAAVTPPTAVPGFETQPGIPAVAALPTQPQRRIVRKVTTRDLILAGLTSNQLASGLAVIGALAAGADDMIDLEKQAPGVVAATEALRRWIVTGGRPVLVAAAAVGLMLLVLLWMLISVMGSIIAFHGFTLSLAGEDLHRGYGLLTRHASSLPRRRVQAVRIEEGLLRRLLGLATLRATSAGSRPTGNETEKTTDILLPVVRRDEVDALLPDVFPDFAIGDESQWRRVSRRAIRRGTFKGSVAVLVLTAVAVFSQGPWGLVLLALVPIVYGLNVIAYRHLGYTTGGGFFRTRRGWLGRSTHVVPVRNIQTLVVRQTPFDRRHGVATVVIDTAGQGAAGGAPQVNNVPFDEALNLATNLAHQAAAQRYRW